MLIFLHGPNSFFSRQKIAEYKKRFIRKYGLLGSLDFFDAEKDEVEIFFRTAAARGVFSDAKLTIVRSLLHFFSPENQSEVVAFFRKNKRLISEKASVIIFWEEGNPEKNSPLFDFLQKNSRIEVFPVLKTAELIKWTHSRLNELNSNLKLSQQAAEKLIVSVDHDVELLNSELMKLASFKENGELTEKDISSITTTKLNVNIFETIEAASTGNKKKALEMLHYQINNKTDPLYLLSMYGYQFRNLLKISDCVQRGLRDKLEISRKTGLHPYIVQRSLSQLNNFDLKKLKRTFSSLQKINADVKAGVIKIDLALDRFIFEL